MALGNGAASCFTMIGVPVCRGLRWAGGRISGDSSGRHKLFWHVWLSVLFDEFEINGQYFLLDDAPCLELAEDGYAIEHGVEGCDLDFCFFDQCEWGEPFEMLAHLRIPDDSPARAGVRDSVDGISDAVGC